MNPFNIERAFQDKAKRGWETLYVLIDAHGTLIKPGHDKVEFYPNAVEIMKWFNNRNDFKVILWTSSHQEEVTEIQRAAAKEGFFFDYINSNPAEQNSTRANFDKKFYFNILLEDKAGFVGETDWALVKQELTRIGEW